MKVTRIINNDIPIYAQTEQFFDEDIKYMLALPKVVFASRLK